MLLTLWVAMFLFLLNGLMIDMIKKYTLQERRDIVNSKMINSIASLISVPELMAMIHALNGDSIQNLTCFHDQFEFEFPVNGDLIARLV